MKLVKLFFFILLFSCNSPSNSPDSNSNQTLFNEPPAWAQDAIWYQIFVERFRNGDSTNDPTIDDIQGSWPHKFGENWQVKSWTGDWFNNPENLPGKEFYDFDIQTRRYGGDLQGILDKLDYMQDLGITAIYFNPLNDAPSLHKFDARNYRHIDVNFGSDPIGDKKIMATEDPLDPSTWKWTSADKLFLQVIKELHKRDIKLVLDYSWNHTGIKFWAWQDILKNGENSKYAHWYEIESFDDPATSENEFKYNGWAGVAELPELKKVDVEKRVHGKPYKGNIHPDIKEHIFNVSKRWLDPNGDGNCDDGIDGFRLDVADQIGMDFWKDYRKYVRSVNPNTLLVGEIWWESWPDVLMNPRPYVNGDVFDIVMFYQSYKPARAFFAKASAYGGAEKLRKDWTTATSGMSNNTVKSMMAMSASHDTPRISTSFLNKGKYKVRPRDNKEYLTGQPDKETFERIKLYLAYQFTMPGAPQIYAGDEMGMWGGDDPDCRKPLWWEDMDFEKESADPYKSDTTKYQIGFNRSIHDYYKKLAKIRSENPVLRRGELNFLHAEGDLLIFERIDEKQRIRVLINNSTSELKLPKNFSSNGKDLFNVEALKIKSEPEYSLDGLSFHIILENDK